MFDIKVHLITVFLVWKRQDFAKYTDKCVKHQWGLYRGYRDTGYLPFYFQGIRILCLISGILFFCRKIKENEKTTTVKVPLKDESLKRKRLSKRFFWPEVHDLTVLMGSFYEKQEEGF